MYVSAGICMLAVVCENVSAGSCPALNQTPFLNMVLTVAF